MRRQEELLKLKDNRKIAFPYSANNNNNNTECIELYLSIVNSVFDSDAF